MPLSGMVQNDQFMLRESDAFADTMADNIRQQQELDRQYKLQEEKHRQNMDETRFHLDQKKQDAALKKQERQYAMRAKNPTTEAIYQLRAGGWDSLTNKEQELLSQIYQDKHPGESFEPFDTDITNYFRTNRSQYGYNPLYAQMYTAEYRKDPNRQARIRTEAMSLSKQRKDMLDLEALRAERLKLDKLRVNNQISEAEYKKRLLPLH
jgi:hypothetical protein